MRRVKLTVVGIGGILDPHFFKLLVFVHLGNYGIAMLVTTADFDNRWHLLRFEEVLLGRLSLLEVKQSVFNLLDQFYDKNLVQIFVTPSSSLLFDVSNVNLRLSHPSLRTPILLLCMM